jgi:hypothetical protein
MGTQQLRALVSGVGGLCSHALGPRLEALDYQHGTQGSVMTYKSLRGTIDWCDLEQVKAYATKLARQSRSQNTVFKLADKNDYHVCPTHKQHLYLNLPGVVRIFTTGDFRERKRT